MTTDLTLSVEQIIEYYGPRWKTESGFKEIKQEIGSSKAQVRNAESVLNHLRPIIRIKSATDTPDFKSPSRHANGRILVICVLWRNAWALTSV